MGEAAHRTCKAWILHKAGIYGKVTSRKALMEESHMKSHLEPKIELCGLGTKHGGGSIMFLRCFFLISRDWETCQSWGQVGWCQIKGSPKRKPCSILMRCETEVEVRLRMLPKNLAWLRICGKTCTGGFYPIWQILNNFAKKKTHNY